MLRATDLEEGGQNRGGRCHHLDGYITKSKNGSKSQTVFLTQVPAAGKRLQNVRATERWAKAILDLTQPQGSPSSEFSLFSHQDAEGIHKACRLCECFADMPADPQQFLPPPI